MTAAAAQARFWQPGTTIEWVYEGTGRHADKPNVRPMTVVRDDEDGLVAWLAPGTPLIKPVLVDGRETRYAGPVAMFRDLGVTAELTITGPVTSDGVPVTLRLARVWNPVEELPRVSPSG